jgi:large conductance mechanosensitive channel
MSLRQEFREFVFRGNVVDLAVGVIIGAAFGKITTAFVSDLVMPFIQPLLPGDEWRKAFWEPIPKMKFLYADFLATVIDFLIVALVLFLLLVKLVGFLNRKPPPPRPPATKTCPECLETVPEAARRCRACTAPLVTAPAGAR